MSLLSRLIVKLAHSRLGIPVKALVRKVRETYYNADVISRPLSKTASLELKVESSAPRRINILIPEIHFARFYGGYIAKFHLARKLHENGYRVRVITVDQCLYDPETWRKEIAAYSGLEDIFDHIEVQCCFERKHQVTVSPDDRFIATTWWTAYIANAAVEQLGIERFIYLIQEYEPFTFPMGSYYALANASYDFPHVAFYSTKLLQDYFVKHNVGYLHNGGANDQERFSYFENSIVRYEDNNIHDGVGEGVCRLLFYARPEAHAARNMFEIGYMALCRAIDEGSFDHARFEFHGIGSSHGDIPLPRGHKLTMLGKFGLSEYKQRLRDYDLGLALMYTPHPSLLPLEMAAAGMCVVTNSCMNKTSKELSQISSNLLTASPTIAGVVEQLDRASRSIADISTRVVGARVNWANDWDSALDESRMNQIAGWLN